MASDTPPPTQPQPPPDYWCHHCDKRVSIESDPEQPDLICSECKFGFIESISPPSVTPDFYPFIDDPGIDETTLGSQFLSVLRLLSQVAREDHSSPPSPTPPSPSLPRASFDDRDNDILRIEIDGENEDEDEDEFGNENENDDEDGEEEEEEDEETVRIVEIEGDSNDETEDDVQTRQRRDMIQLHLREFATRRNRMDWREILRRLEENSIQVRFETDRYVGNPGDYVNEAEFDALLQNLAEAGEGRRGAPPASKSAIDGLKDVEVKNEDGCFVCAVCKDGVNVGDVVKEMPCGHGYHGDCIVPWLAARNSCPVCRFELPTDDVEYEEGKRKGAYNSGCDAGSSSVLGS